MCKFYAISRARTYLSKDAYVAEQAVQGTIDAYGAGGDKPHPMVIAQEPSDLSKNRYSMLLPVLQQKQVWADGKIEHVYKVGYLTSMRSQRHKNSTSLELMFVVDATTVKDYLKATGQIISRIAGRIKRIRNAGLRVGLICYRDYVKHQAEM